jgi:hypothetical protein
MNLKFVKIPVDLPPMMIEAIKTGDNLLIRNPNDFVSRSIVGVMKDYAKEQGYTSDPNFDINFTFSHAATFVWVGGKLYLYGSIDSGYKPILFNKHYDWYNDQYCIMRRNGELTIEDENTVITECQHLVTVSNGYRYWMFLGWLAKVYLNFNTFGKRSPEHFTYCYESTRLVRQALSGNTDPTAITDVYELIYDPEYSVIYRNNC